MSRSNLNVLPQLRQLLIVLVLVPGVAYCQGDFERSPINYSESEATDPVARLAARLESKGSQLTWDADHGYLKSLLRELNVPESSQTLVFSKTSLQVRKITPQRPRAVYFNDDVYVGWVQRGDVIELSAADPQLGGTFYTLSQEEALSPTIVRETSRCLQCHGSSHTRRIPGHLVRSVYTDRRGQPVFRLGTHVTNDRSPFNERWGGWYVTGTHGALRHMGNVTLQDPDENDKLDTESGANITDLSQLINVRPYLNAHSDIVALMVLQHQTQVHNVLTAANHSGRLTARDSETMNKALGRDPEFESDSTQRRYQSAANKVVKALLLCKETTLTSSILGTSPFAEAFQNQGPACRHGRSLRQLDLQTRLFQYPCSFLIYADSFHALPTGVLNRVITQLSAVLSGENTSRDFSHLTAEDRVAILEILASTHPSFMPPAPQN